MSNQTLTKRGKRTMTILTVILVILALAAVGVGYYLYKIQDVAPSDTSASFLNVSELCNSPYVAVKTTIITEGDGSLKNETGNISNGITQIMHGLSPLTGTLDLINIDPIGSYYIGVFEPIKNYNPNSGAYYNQVKFILNGDEYTGQLVTYNELQTTVRTAINNEYEGEFTTDELATFTFAQIDMSETSDSLEVGANSLLIKMTISDPSSPTAKEASCSTTFTNSDGDNTSTNNNVCNYLYGILILRDGDTDEYTVFKDGASINSDGNLNVQDIDENDILYFGHLIRTPSNLDIIKTGDNYTSTLDYTGDGNNGEISVDYGSNTVSSTENPNSSEPISIMDSVRQAQIEAINEAYNIPSDGSVKTFISQLAEVPTGSLTSGLLSWTFTDRLADKTCEGSFNLLDQDNTNDGGDDDPIVVGGLCQVAELYAVKVSGEDDSVSLHEQGTEITLDLNAGDKVYLTALSSSPSVYVYDIILADDTVLASNVDGVELPETSDIEYVNLLANTISADLQDSTFYYLPYQEVPFEKLSSTFTINGQVKIKTSPDVQTLIQGAEDSCGFEYSLLAGGEETPDTSNIIVTVSTGETCVERVAGSNTTTTTVRIRNADTDLEDVTKLVVKLPLGFTYTAGSTRVNGTAIADTLVTQTDTGSTTDLTITPEEPWTLLSNQTMNLTVNSSAGSSALTGTVIFEAIATPTNDASDENSLRSQATLTVAQSCTSPSTGLFDNIAIRIIAGLMLIVSAAVFYKSNRSQEVSEKLLESGVSTGIRLFGLRLTNPREYFEEKFEHKEKQKKK